MENLTVVARKERLLKLSAIRLERFHLRYETRIGNEIVMAFALKLLVPRGDPPPLIYTLHAGQHIDNVWWPPMMKGFQDF
jgi:hypothetical protein